MIAIALEQGAALARPTAVQTQMVLRLHELPPEYDLGSGTGCGVLGTKKGETRKAVEEFALAYRAVTCAYWYERRFELPGAAPAPPLVVSFAIGTSTARAAGAGFGIAGELLREYLGEPALTEVPGAPPLGDEAKLFHTRRAFAAGLSRQPGSALFWRTGNTLAALYLAGMPIATGDGVALQLAQVQQQHIESPTPYTAAEQDDTLVPLEDPAITIPVYWLGPTFRPGRGLPPSQLRDGYFPSRASAGPPGMKALLSYDHISLSTYTQASWRQLLRSSIGSLVRGWHCTEKSRVTVPGGSAAVYAGYAEDYRDCPSRPPNVVFAEVHLGGLVIGVDLPNCEYCIEPRRGPYSSERDMKIIARALQLRPQPGS